MPYAQETFSAFANGNRCLAHGPMFKVAKMVRLRLEVKPDVQMLIFSDKSGQQVDLDLSGSMEDIQNRYPRPQPSRGRPKLGVVAKEVTLLPRHWDWLDDQGGAAQTLRRLVEAAMKTDGAERRLAGRRAFQFMTAIAGDRPGYEEAVRALFNGDEREFRRHMRDWPIDIVAHARKLAEGAFEPS